MNPLRDFVAFDLETTGLERDADEIIEIGAVRVRGGVAEATMSCLLQATRPLTPLVESLTGISKAMLADARPPAECLREFLDFAQRLPLVAHNSDFDSAFLAQALAAQGMGTLANPVYDSLLLARTAWPGFDSHRLENLVTALGIPHQPAHRALPDAEQAAHVWQRAQDALAKRSPETLKAMGHVLGDGPQQWRTLFGGPEGGHADFDAAGLIKPAQPSAPAAASQAAPEAASAEALFTGSAAASAFAAAGRPYQARARQARMAYVAERAFHEGRLLAVDAEPGTGRALACLAAAVRHARERRRPVCYAVAGRGRLERLAARETPLLKAMLGDARVEALKAPSAYVSPRKLAGVLAHPGTRLAPEERMAMLPLLSWLEDAGDGDIAANMGFNHERHRLLWSKLSSDTYAAEPGGHAYAARERAQRAHVVLVTHDLVLDDLALDFALLPSYDALICDDAHKLPEAGQARLGREVSFFRLKHILQLIAQSKSDGRGLLAELERGAGVTPPPEPAPSEAAEAHTGAESAGTETAGQVTGELPHAAPPEPLTDLQSLRRKAFEPERQLQKFFNKIAKHAQKRRKDGENRIRYADKLVVEFLAGPEHVLASLLEVEELLRRLAGGRPDLAQDLGRAADLLRAFRADLDHLAHPSGEGDVYWIEDFPNPHRALIRSAPLSIGPALAERFLPQMESAVFASPAISIGDDFKFFCHQVGLDVNPERLKTALVRARGADEGPDPLFIARYSPVLSNQGVLPAVLQSVMRGLRRLPRPAFALFTHIGLLKQARALLSEGLAADGRMVLAQHVDGGRDNLLHLFRHRTDAVLLGTEAFFDTLDGDDSFPAVVMVTKLPFPVPSEPLIAPHLEKVQEAGGNPLHDYLLPVSILRLKQELNRLPRRPGQPLAIWILDPRLATEKYARFYQRGLGRDTVVFQKEEDLFAKTAEVLGIPWSAAAELAAPAPVQPPEDAAS